METRKPDFYNIVLSVAGDETVLGYNPDKEMFRCHVVAKDIELSRLDHVYSIIFERDWDWNVGPIIVSAERVGEDDVCQECGSKVNKE